MTILSMSVPAVGLTFIAYAFAFLVFHQLRTDADTAAREQGPLGFSFGSAYVEAALGAFAAGAVPLACVDAAGLFPEASHLPQHMVYLLVVLILKAAFAAYKAPARLTPGA